MPVPAGELHLIRAIEREALLALRDGSATERDVHAINAAAVLAERLGGAGVGPEVLPLARAVQEALWAAWSDGGPRVLSPGDIALCAELLDVHDQQRQLARRSEFEAAVAAVVQTGGSDEP